MPVEFGTKLAQLESYLLESSSLVTAASLRGDAPIQAN